MLDKFDPLKGERFQILDKEGSVLPESEVFLPHLGKDLLIEMYRNMVISRMADTKGFNLQRSGRMTTFAQVTGQEAAQVGACSAMEKEDWMFPAFREISAYYARKTPLYLFYLYNMGHEMGQQFPKELNNFSHSVPVASHLLHAVGVAWAAKMKKDTIATVVFFGDGATSEGDFHEAMNFAGVFKTPTVFVCQNNQYAISVSRENQTAAKTIAQKAIAYGFRGIQVDGNDVLAMYAATKEALDNAKKGGGPTLIEAFTYRLADHTTSDDAKQYRKQEEVEQWKPLDPIPRFKKYLEKEGLWTEQDEQNLLKEGEQIVEAAVKKAEDFPKPSPEDIFKFTFAEMTPPLNSQLEGLKKELSESKVQ